MTQVMSYGPRSMDAATAPAHALMDLNKAVRDNGPQFVSHQSPSPVPGAVAGMVRKRSASLNLSSENVVGHGRLFDQLSIDTSVTMKHDNTGRDSICLCTPTPKIPRPRNAFILYRQHHQSQVTADNPKLSNPEISKIIGDKWKHELEDVKETWKKLAEEEKQRHQHQYPNYRYQPRRGSKAQGNWPGTPAAGDDQGRCLKCNGRSIATPRTPSTPVATPPSNKMSHGGPPTLGRLDTNAPRRMSMELSPGGSLPMPHQHHFPPVRGLDDSGDMSPEMKRRRANGAGNYHAVGRSQNPDQMHASPEGVSQHGGAMRSYPGTALPDLSTIPRSHSGPMPPPPRPPGAASWGEPTRNRRHSGFDESLRLPPLQTSMSPTHARHSMTHMLPAPNFELSSPDEIHSGNQEEAVMAIPLVRKLGLLSRMSRPIAASSPRDKSSSNYRRGAFVTVEGPNPRILHAVGQAVEKYLLACSEVHLRGWIGDAEAGDSAIESDRHYKRSDMEGSPDGDGSFPSYFRTVMSWQERSREITDFVSRGEQQQQDERSKSADKIAVALIKEGFSLTLADRFACTTPIADWFSPQDHWQWMASLWRGIPSPDLIVYAKPSDEEEIKQRGSVEFIKQAGLMVIRISDGKPVDEAIERRLSFELMEWIREGSFREEVPVNWRLDS